MLLALAVGGCGSSAPFAAALGDCLTQPDPAALVQPGLVGGGGAGLVIGTIDEVYRRQLGITEHAARPHIHPALFGEALAATLASSGLAAGAPRFGLSATLEEKVEIGLFSVRVEWIVTYRLRRLADGEMVWSDLIASRAVGSGWQGACSLLRDALSEAARDNLRRPSLPVSD